METKTQRVIQMGFDIKIPDDLPTQELESLFNHLVEKIDNFYDVKNNRVGIESIGQFNWEDMTKQYKAHFDYENKCN